MDKTLAGLLGAVGALASLNTAQAAPSSDPSEVLKAGSFADLLEPIPNAMEKLQAIDETGSSPKVRLAQFFVEHHHPITTITAIIGNMDLGSLLPPVIPTVIGDMSTTTTTIIIITTIAIIGVTGTMIRNKKMAPSAGPFFY